MEDLGSNAGEQTVENTQNQTQENQGQQYSPEFQERMASAKRALDIGNEGNNTYSQPDTEESSFNTENNAPAAPVEPQGNPLEQGIANAAEKPVEAPDNSAVNMETGADQEAPAKTETSEAVVTSAMTGDINFNAESESEEDAPSVVFELPKDFEEFLVKGNLGLTKDNISTELPKLVERSAMLDQVSNENKGFKTVFESLPSDLYNAILAWNEGNDYRSVIQEASRFSLDKAFEDHGNKEMVDSYFPGKITEEEWQDFKDPDGDLTVKEKIGSYVDLSKEKYSVDQSKHKMEASTYEQKASELNKTRQQAFEASRQQLPATFKESFPIQESYINEVDKVAQNKDSILGLFYNQDGALKPEAHARIAMAMGGEELVKSQAEALKSKLMSQAREEVIRNTPDSIQIKKSAEQGASESELAQQNARKRAQELVGPPRSNTYG